MKIDFSQSAMKNGYLKAGEYLNTLPKNSKFSGFGWWQAPNISFTSGKHFVDLQKTSLEKIKNNIKVYIVTDNYVTTIDPGSIEFTSQKYPNKITYQDKTNYITIYQIIRNQK